MWQNWGMIPFTADKNDFETGDLIYVENVAQKLKDGETEFVAKVKGKTERTVKLRIDALTEAEKETKEAVTE